MARGPTRPPGPPPLRLELWFAPPCNPEGDSPSWRLDLEIDAEAEPAIAKRIGELVDAGAFRGVELIRRKAEYLVLGEAPGLSAWEPVEPRRVRDLKFTAGVIGWDALGGHTWKGHGGFFIALDDAPGLNAFNAPIGHVVDGLEALQALPVRPAVQLRGRPPLQPVKIESMRRAVDVQRV